MKPEDWYTQKLSETEACLRKVNSRILYISIIRVVLFVGCLSTVIALWGHGAATVIIGACCTLIPFLVMIKVHNRYFMRRLWLETKAAIIKNEIKGLHNDFSGFDEGKEFVDPGHPYTLDLDIFGRKSLFQAINRTGTHIGRKILAGWMQSHLRKKEDIEIRQQAVMEMSSKNAFRLRFAVTGMINRSQSADDSDIRTWVETESELTAKTWPKVLVLAVPAINIILLVCSLIGVVPFSWFGLSFSAFVILSFGVIKKATALQEEYGNKLKTLSTYARLITLMQNETWESKGTRDIIRKLEVDGKSPSDIISMLTRELDRLDLRNNQILYVVLEGSMFFQLRQMLRIEAWKDKYGKYLGGWLEAVGEIDALCSLGTFAYNHPDYRFAEITDTPFSFVAKDLGHPLMPEQQCVRNDALIPARPYFLIITGANMAGKSTYLRTIGVNYLLACIGAPSCCTDMRIYPSQLITSLRTSDSLSDNESYFFAELKRLKRIIDMLNSGEELFIILDEILKGTNSTDKQKGSFSLIRQFMNLKANGIIATHDLLLGELVNYFPDGIRNYCFEADIKDNELYFSYKIREGIARNMNACFLMKKMGIVIDEE